MVKATHEIVRSMRMAKVFHDNTAPVNSIDFSDNGELFVTASDDESLHLYSCTQGTFKKKVLSRKYGVDLVRFTHHDMAVLVASKNNWDDSLRYHSLHDNRYLRYFQGHRDRVVSLEMSMRDDLFLSGSLDQTVRLWDLKTNVCQGLLRVNGQPAVGIDPQGLVFAVAASNAVNLFDIRAHDKGPFDKFVLPSPHVNYVGLKFGPDGKTILLTTATGGLILLDAFKGNKIQEFPGLASNGTVPGRVATYSPDAQFVLCGSDDGTVHVWSTLTGHEVAVWRGHIGHVGPVLWNPEFMMAASADVNVAFWLPEDNKQ
eukprot:TRINITY_DN22080_c0_g1_i1.p1 TRINITY_DN22080_c0_g1~~TRINITY_DN22080_c0_g1_i1.p1  ORF type:complete len:315 (-),score=63.21 TRINITY_DN22080_c0_g1_i1:10-954(-)